MQYVRYLTGLVPTFIFLSLLPSCYQGANMHSTDMRPKEVVALFPSTLPELEQMLDNCIQSVKQQIAVIVALQPSEHTFDNTVRAADALIGTIGQCSAILQVVAFTAINDELREAANKAMVALQHLTVDLVSQNEQLYQSFVQYQEHAGRYDRLSKTERYVFDESMKDFQRNGLELPETRRARIKKVQKELAQISVDFEKNINEDKSTIAVPAQDLTGLPDDYIATLARDEQGNCIIGVDGPTYIQIMKHCSNGAVRKKLLYAYMNRAYPQNVDVLSQMVAKRYELAQLLEFETFAALDLDDQMVENPERARTFLTELAEKALFKQQKDVDNLKAHLPEGVTLTADGKFYPWDLAYVSEQYKQKYHNVDDRVIAEYFPAHMTVEKLLGVYEKFFGIRFEQMKDTTLWAPEVTLVKVTRAQDGLLLGYLLLDLYPRKNKYNHACKIGVVPALLCVSGKRQPAVAVVLANFPRGTAQKPALLKHSDVSTFFHEFGHAIHALLGATEFAGTSGTNVKRDFVEMPSQMLEEWLYDREVLRVVSHHYKTGQPLPDDLIERMIALKQFNAGLWVCNQLYYSLLSLDLFNGDWTVNPEWLSARLHNQLKAYEEIVPEFHMYTSFGHLDGYGAKYYGYLWSKVFALDLFDQLKHEGLFNPAAGKRYAQTVLEPGGSYPPDVLLRNFLGREPRQDAFLRDMGMTI